MPRRARRPVADFPWQALFSGRYHDEPTLIDGRWRFIARWALPDVIGDMGRHIRNPLRPGPLRSRG